MLLSLLFLASSVLGAAFQSSAHANLRGLFPWMGNDSLVMKALDQCAQATGHLDDTDFALNAEVCERLTQLLLARGDRDGIIAVLTEIPFGYSRAKWVLHYLKRYKSEDFMDFNWVAFQVMSIDEGHTLGEFLSLLLSKKVGREKLNQVLTSQVASTFCQHLDSFRPEFTRAEAFLAFHEAAQYWGCGQNYEFLLHDSGLDPILKVLQGRLPTCRLAGPIVFRVLDLALHRGISTALLKRIVRYARLSAENLQQLVENADFVSATKYYEVMALIVPRYRHDLRTLIKPESFLIFRVKNFDFAAYQVLHLLFDSDELATLLN